MQTKRYSSKTASIRFLIGYLLITSTLMSHPTTKPICHWQEAENFSSVSINDDRAISSKPPASGSKSTSGAIFIEAGSKLQYDIVLEKAIPGAKMVLRYARLHFRENMPPAKFMLSISTGGSAFHQSFVCGDTHGWGTLKSAEWSYLEVPLQEDLDPGPLEITITAMEDSSNVNFDGFYISNPAFKIQPEETHGVERIRFSNTGYIGLKIAGDTVIPGAFDGFEIVGRSFPSEKIKVSAFMEDPQGKKISILDTVSFATDNSRKSVAVGAGAFAGIPDGFYELKLIAGDNPELLRFPLTVLGDLVTRAREESQAFQSTAELFKVSRISGEQAFVPDLEHAAEYLDNTILLLEARQQGKATSSERTAALAYFERSKARTSKDFAEDMEAIIE